MFLFSFDAQIIVTPKSAERLSAELRAMVRAGRTRIALRAAPDAEWTEQAVAVWARECRRIGTWLVGQLAESKPAVRIGIEVPDGSPLAVPFARAMQPYAALVRRQRVVRWTTALVAATVAGVALAACGGEAITDGVPAAGSTGAGGAVVGGYGGGYGGAGVCAAGGYYGGGVCAVYLGGYGGVGVDAAVADAAGDGRADAGAGGAAGQGGYGAGGAGVCAAGGYYGAGVCPVAVGGYYGGGICAVQLGGFGGVGVDAAAADAAGDATSEGSIGAGGYPGGIC